MKKLLSLSVVAALGWMAVFSLPAANAQVDYSNLLNRFNEMINTGQPATTAGYEPMVTSYTPQGNDVLTGHVTCTPAGACFLNNGTKSTRVLGTKMSKQIMQAVIYDQVQITGTLSKSGTVLGDVTDVTSLSAVSHKYTPVMMPSAWTMVTYTGWIITSANGKVYLRRSDSYGNVMKKYGKPMEYLLQNNANWRLPFQFVGKGIVSVSGMANDAKWVLRFDDGNSINSSGY